MTKEKIAEFLNAVLHTLNEKQRRHVAAATARLVGRGGQKMVCSITGLAGTTIRKGLEELSSISEEQSSDKGRAEDASSEGKAVNKADLTKDGRQRIRQEGAGRKKVRDAQPNIVPALLALLDGDIVGNPENPLCWTTKSTYNLAEELTAQGFKVGPRTVAALLKEEGFSLQQNKKYISAAKPNDDRDEQFRNINEFAKSFMAQDCPVVSIDAKKKELIGKFKNVGAEYRPVGDPQKVNDHDFVGELGKATPYGIYDINANEGFVNVGIGPDTAEFAAHSLSEWWLKMGAVRYPNAKKLMITADGGGSNGSRNRLWKQELQKFANKYNLEVHVFHYPPGTSKWNKIEHRLFAQISKNWRGKPLETLEIIVNLIAATTTKTGLKVMCQADVQDYQKGIKVTDEQMAELNLLRRGWRGDWNYVIFPQIHAMDAIS